MEGSSASAVERNRGNLPAGMKEFIEELLFPTISWIKYCIVIYKLQKVQQTLLHIPLIGGIFIEKSISPACVG